MSQEDYEKSYSEAVILYQKENFNTENIYESDTHPMHPNLFYQLSSVSGFNNLNGKTYQIYLNNWKIRNNYLSKSQ